MLTVISSAVAISLRSIGAMISFLALHVVMVAAHFAIHLLHHPSHIVLTHATHAIAVPRLRSPIAADLNILTALLFLPARLLRLLRRALWFHRNSLWLRRSRSRLGLALNRRQSLLLGECGDEAS
jgi:hypothetical protein